MAKEKIRKIVERYKLYEYRDTEVVQSLDLYAHVQKHISEFKNINSYNHAIKNIPEIISNPFFVYYNCDKKSLLYFKKFDENVCVVVKLNLRKNKDTYVATMYPISENKILKYKEMSYILKE